MAVEPVEEQAAEPVGLESVETTGGGNGVQGREQEISGGEEPHAVEAKGRARGPPGIMGPITEPLGTGMAASDSEQTRGGSGGDVNEENRRATEPDARVTEQAGAVGSSSGLDDSGMVAEGPPMVERGSSGVEGSTAIEEVQTTEADPVEVRVEDIAFRPPAGAATSSRHVPITYADIAEHAPDELLVKLLEDHPVIGEYVLKAEEDRARAIEAAEAAARAEREAEGERAGDGLAADVEAEEAEAEEALGPRVSAVAEAGALERPEFSGNH
ncbi:hypothetical protein RHMOL_Rhmol07G0200300 [Rhododendron molle]|uniref:Uncharacterized protein n=1 Tax=Rhododendron molle TaxID=49168 RepID=A0ACC0N2V9_RHOML|nr:hypothetical protein RHMOL_Rhmol07G0200300 [Rhododendron molle]